jgi:probable HAF family extracellular repeat protein
MRRVRIVKIPVWVMVLTMSAFVFAASSSVAEADSATGGYRLIDLGTLGGESSYATAMNNRGDVVGSSAVADGSYHGFLWRRGKMLDLGLFRPVNINNKGQVVGTLDNQNTAYLWFKGTLTNLGTLGGLSSYPTAINDRGQVVGMSDTADSFIGVPFLWSKGHMRRLPLDSVSDINNRGQVAGGQRHGDVGFHAGVWHRGRTTDLGVGAGAFDRSNTYGINDKGWVIGWTLTTDHVERGALWRKTTVTDVGTLGGGHTQLKAVNDHGQILAESQIPDGNIHPALWRRSGWTDLTTVGLGAEDSVVDLNNRGEIAATIRPVFGISHAVIYRSSTGS